MKSLSEIQNFNLSKLEFETVIENLGLQQIANLCKINKKFLCEEFLTDYFENHKRYSLVQGYSIEEILYMNIFVEDFYKSNDLDWKEFQYAIASDRLHLIHSYASIIPKSIENLTNLKRICLYDNRITEIPKEIGNLVNLEDFHLDGNQITEIPEEIENLVNLT